ncbi:MAG: hypothetical protein KKA42_08345 [candidate division Zixibacteria bacterium]|nr:hypothetical protein [candidate division Zixibacteria bacterium]
MNKQIIVAGCLGAIVMFVWLVVSYTMLPLSGRQEIRTVDDQLELHAFLKARISEPGKYAVPYLAPGQEALVYDSYRDEPLYEVTYQGYTHNTVPGFLTIGMFGFLFAPLLAAGLLAHAAPGVLQTYGRRVLYVVILGLFLSFGSDWLRGLTGEHTTGMILRASVNQVITWALVGAVLAWRIKPK